LEEGVDVFDEQRLFGAYGLVVVGGQETPLSGLQFLVDPGLFFGLFEDPGEVTAFGLVISIWPAVYER
jgi:hypothetical protein